jgi:CheY-like chemotaxis protein
MRRLPAAWHEREDYSFRISTVLSGPPKSTEANIRDVVDFDPSVPGDSQLDPQPIRLDAVLKATVAALRSSFPAHVAVSSTLRVHDAMVVADEVELAELLVALGHEARARIGNQRANIDFRVDREPLPIGMAVSGVDDSYLAIVVSHDVQVNGAASLDGRAPLLSRVSSALTRYRGFLDTGKTARDTRRTALLLPEHVSHKTQKGVTSVAATPSCAPLVLLAEDEPTISRIATRILTHAGYRVVAATDGHEALALLDVYGDEIKLAILDAVMPGLDGQAVFARLKQLRPELPVLFSSGYDQGTWPSALLEQAGVGLLPKPYDPPMLLQAMEKLLPLEPS